MAAKFWILGGKLVVNGSGNPCLTEACPCTDTVSSPCNGSDRVNKSMVLTFNWNGITKNMPITWIASTSSCFGGQGWEYTTPDIDVCLTGSPTLKLVGFALCCSTTTWFGQLAVKFNAILDSFISGSNMTAFTVVATSPMHLQATIPGLTACGVTDDALIDIQ